MMRQAGIIGVGGYVPPKVITNDYYTGIYRISERAIEKKTGIIERRFLEPGMNMLDMALYASHSAFEDSGLKPSDIDFVMVSTITQERIYPSMACQVQDRLGVPTNAGVMDISIGCAGFVYAFLTACQYVKTGFANRILVIGVDHCSRNMHLDNEEDRGMNILFGDGAGAVIVSEVPEGRGLLSAKMGSDGSGAEYMYEDENHRGHMDGGAIYNFATEKIPETIQEVLSDANISLSELDYIIPHQANLRIIEKSVQILGFPIEKVATNAVRYYGNTSSASVVLALNDEVKSGRIKDGDYVVLAGFGAGLSWASALLKWGY